jgi:hypothetical protein
MAIRSGIGIGEAQVYDISNLENNYFKILQRQAQETAKFQYELVDLIGKVKTDGARDIDKPLIAKGYEEIKDLYRKASSIRNKTERNLVRAQISSGVQSLNEAAARSAEEAKLYIDTLGRIANTGEYMYDTNKLNDFKQRINKPITQLTAFNPLDLPKIPDDSVRDRAYDNLYTELKPKAVYEVRKAAGNREQEVGVINPTFVANNIMERLNKSPEWLNLATRNYIQENPGKTPEFKDIALNEVKLYMTRKGNEYVGSPTRIPKATGTGSGDGEDKLTYRQKLITGLINQDEDYRQELQANLPANSKIEYGVSRKVSGVSKGGYKYIKIRIPAESTENGIEVVETIPLEAGKPIQKLNYIINQYSPEKVSPSKVGITGGKPRGDKFEVGQQPAAKKEIKQSDIKAKALAAGYSVAEYTKLLQKNGIKIIK